MTVMNAVPLALDEAHVDAPVERIRPPRAAQAGQPWHGPWGPDIPQEKSAPEKETQEVLVDGADVEGIAHQYVVYRTLEKRWRWVLLARNSKRLAESARDYTSKENCVRALFLTIGVAATAPVWNCVDMIWEVRGP